MGEIIAFLVYVLLGICLAAALVALMIIILDHWLNER